MFAYFFGCMLGEIKFKHTDNLSQTLQHACMSAAKCQQVVSMTVATVTSLQSEKQCDLLGISSFSRQMSLKIISFSYHENETCHIHVDLMMENQLETSIKL